MLDVRGSIEDSSFKKESKVWYFYYLVLNSDTFLQGTLFHGKYPQIEGRYRLLTGGGAILFCQLAAIRLAL